MPDHLSNATRWTLSGDHVEVTTGVIHTADGETRVYLALENTLELREVTGGRAPIQADGHLTATDVDVLIARLLAAKAALREAGGL